MIVQYLLCHASHGRLSFESNELVPTTTKFSDHRQSQLLLINVVFIPKIRQMHPTPLRFARVIPRRLLKVNDLKINKRPTPQSEDRTRRPTLIDLLEVQKKKAGESWPPNLRLERQLRKDDFKQVRQEVKSALKKLTKER